MKIIDEEYKPTTCFICNKPTPPDQKFCYECLEKYVLNKMNQNYKNYTPNINLKYTNCAICEKESNGNPFCFECFDKHDPDILLKLLNKLSSKKIYEPSKTKCITCNDLIDNKYMFCKNCYAKYKNKELCLKITNCKNTEILEEHYQSKKMCDDGHLVKSKSEREIDNFLFQNKIIHAYEKEIRYGNEENQVLHPDFYLPDYLGAGKDVYIEHWGFGEENESYTKSKEFKLKIYRKMNLTVICTYESESDNITSRLRYKLNKKNIIEDEINFENNDNKPSFFEKLFKYI